MKEEVLKALELEKSKREILKQAQKRSEEWSKACAEDPIVDAHKYAWEYEIEQYRKEKIRARFWTIGAVCGIVALILQLVLNYQSIVNILM
ncbi:hypothetical protein ACR6HW_15665 [Fusibacter sp. JL298sf-3]